MKINKKILLELGVADNGSCVKQDTIVENTRWSAIHEVFFAYKDKFYRTEYSVGLTEQQDESPWGHEDDDIDCVEAKLQTIAEWTVPQWVIKK